MAESARMTAESARFGRRGQGWPPTLRGELKKAPTEYASGRPPALGTLRGKVEEGARARVALESHLPALEELSGPPAQSIDILNERVHDLDQIGGDGIHLFTPTRR